MGDKVYGSTGNIGHLFSYHPASDTSTDLGQALPDIDSIRSLTVYNGLIYGGTGQYNVDGRLFVYDPVANVTTDLGAAIAGEYYIQALVASSDGKIYGGTGWDGHLFYYDTGSSSFVDLGIVPSGSSICSLAIAPDGKIYGGTYGGYLFSYDPLGGTFSNLGKPVAYEYYLYALIFGPDGLLYGGSGYEHGRFFAYDPASGTVTDKGRAAWGVNAVRDLAEDGAGRIYGGGEQLFVYDALPPAYHPPGTALSADIIPSVRHLSYIPYDNDIYALTVAPTGWVYGGGGEGGHLFAYDPTTETLNDLGVVATEHYIYALTTGPDGRIYGGTYNWLGAGFLFYYDPLTGQIYNLGVPTTYTENGVSALTVGPDGLIYGGTFGDSIDISGRFFSYDPELEEIDAKGRVHDDEDAVTGLAVGDDGKIYIATGWNGHLAAYDPVADVWPPEDVWSNPNNTEVLSIAAGEDGRIYFGLGDDGHLMVYDPFTGGVTDLGQPVSGAEEIVALTPHGSEMYGAVNRYVYGRMQTILFAYDVNSDAIRTIGHLVVGEDQVNCLATGAEHIYAGTGYQEGHLLSYQPAYTEDMGWGTVHFTLNTPPSTGVRIDLLSQDGSVVLEDVSDGQGLDTIDVSAYPSLKLQAELSTTLTDTTPYLLDWGVSWVKVQAGPDSLSFAPEPGGSEIISDVVWIAKTGDDEVNWLATTQQDWLSVSPLSGTVPATPTVYVDLSGLEPGFYTGTITLSWGIDTPTHPEVIQVSLLKSVELKYLFLPLVVRKGD